jgi:hypothetical protein
MRICRRLFTIKKAKGRTCVRPFLVTRFIRPHRGAQKGGAANLGSLSEPHHEQNPYANPKRTAKTQPIRNMRLAARKNVQTIFNFILAGRFGSIQIMDDPIALIELAMKNSLE